MITKETVAQIFGLIGIAVFLLCFQFKQMKTARKIKMAVDVIWAVHYFLLGGYSAFAINVICFFREIVFINSDKKFFSSKIWLYIFIAFNLFSAVLTWKTMFSILPAITACIATYSFWQKNIKKARILALVNNGLMFTYDLTLENVSYMGLVAEALAFCSVVIAIIRHKKQTSQ
jgi:hypothetical protein